MIKLELVNEKKELNHILKYLDKNWDNIDVDSVKALWDQAIKATKNELDPYGLNIAIKYMVDFQEECNGNVDEKEIEFLNHKVKVHSFITKLSFGYSDLCSFEKNNRSWDADDFIHHLSNLDKKPKPKYWEPLYSEYQIRDDVVKYMKDKKFAKFTGTNFKFEDRFDDITRMETVMYFAKEQETPPELFLSYSILKHARCVNKHNNHVEMTHEWNEAIHGMQHGDFTLSMKNPLNIALQHMMKENTLSPEVFSAFGIKEQKKNIKP